MISAKHVYDEDLFREFIEFCERKGEEEYSFNNAKNCALAQFARELYGDDAVSGGSFGFFIQGPGIECDYIRIFPENYGPDYAAFALTNSRNFATLAERLRSYL